jgi:peptidoglycan/LPS O-acetylase OafA/YrhL
MSQDLLTTPASTVKTAKSPQAAKTRLDFVDGLRGFAALYVVIAHALLNGWYAESGTRAARGLTLFDRIINLLIWPFSFGHGAVVLFIVLSGYSLMLAVARSNASSLPNGTLDFYRRRALRILPPYYVALVLAIGLFWFVPGFEAGTNTNLSAGQLLSHLILVHNWSSVDIYSIDGPMWSLAVEWQIYFLFPLILIPIWRKWGSLAVAVVSIGLGVAIQFLFDSTQSYIFAWFLGLFTLGMVAASICFSTKPEEVKWRTKLPWGKLCIGFLVIFGVYRTITKGDSEGATTDWFKD